MVKFVAVPLALAHSACVVRLPAVSLTSRFDPAVSVKPALGCSAAVLNPNVSTCVACWFCTSIPRRFGLALSTSAHAAPTLNSRTDQSKAGSSA